MIKKFDCLPYLFALFFLAGCTGKMSREAYMHWVQDYANGLHLKQQISPYVVDLQYMPAAYRWYQRHKEEYPSEDTAQEADFQYYLLKIGFEDGQTDLIKGNTQDKSVWKNRSYYFSFELEHHIRLMADGKSYPCVLYHFERADDIKAERKFVLGFEAPESQYATLTIDAPVISTQPVSFNVTPSKLPNTPL